jgi:hypothetical protein
MSAADDPAAWWESLHSSTSGTWTSRADLEVRRTTNYSGFIVRSHLVFAADAS